MNNDFSSCSNFVNSLVLHIPGSGGNNMQDERSAIIVKEIHYWKQHKMLPEVYCDFLLALYTNGEYSPEEEPVKRKQSWSIVTSVQVFLLVMLVPFSFLVTYFTQFQTVLQLCILFLFLSYAVWLLVRFKKTNTYLLHIPMAVLLILSMLITTYVGSMFDASNWLSIGLIVIHFVVWFGIGKKYHFKYLMVGSCFGAVLASLAIVL